MKTTLDAYEIVLYPLATEKGVRAIEFENKLGFAVAPKATKPQIKAAVENLFKVKVAKVNTMRRLTGEKIAYVKLHPQHLASDISADLGLI